MSQDAIVTTETTVGPSHDLVFFQSVLAAVLKENCRKQEEDIQAIVDSAYITRHGQRELRDPKRLALAIKLRSNHMADFYAYASRIRDWELTQAYVRELVSRLCDVVDSEPPELRRRIGLMLEDLRSKYQPSAEHQSTQSRQDGSKTGQGQRKI